MGLLHLSQSYVPDRFPLESQEEYMPDPRKKVRKPRTTDPRPGQGKPQRARKPQAKRDAPSSRKTAPLGAGRRAASGFSPKTGDVIKRLRALPSLQKARPMRKQEPIGPVRPSSRAAGKLSRTVERAFKRITASKLAPSREGRILMPRRYRGDALKKRRAKR